MLLLKAKTAGGHQHGNGIMYGGTRKQYSSPPETEAYAEHEVFYVETDFGNHMALLWTELTDMFDVIGVRDYEKWKADRLYLQSQPNLIDETNGFGDFTKHLRQHHTPPNDRGFP